MDDMHTPRVIDTLTGLDGLIADAVRAHGPGAIRCAVQEARPCLSDEDAAGVADMILARDDAALEAVGRLVLADQLLARLSREGGRAESEPIIARDGGHDEWWDAPASVASFCASAAIPHTHPRPPRALALPGRDRLDKVMRQMAGAPQPNPRAWAQAISIFLTEGTDVSVPLAERAISAWLERFQGAHGFRGASLRVVGTGQVRELDLALNIAGEGHTWMAATIPLGMTWVEDEALDHDALRQRAREQVAAMGVDPGLIGVRTPVEEEAYHTAERVHDRGGPGAPAGANADLLGPPAPCRHAGAIWEIDQDDAVLVCAGCMSEAARVGRHRLGPGFEAYPEEGTFWGRGYIARQRARAIIDTGKDPGAEVIRRQMRGPYTSRDPHDHARSAPRPRMASARRERLADSLGG